jgi:uridine kinase
MITLASPRSDVQVRFPDGRAFNGPPGTLLGDFIAAAGLPEAGVATAGLIDGKLRELTTPLLRDAAVVPVTTTGSDGMRIYRRSLTFLLIAAAAELYPGREIHVEHSIPVGGYYCEVVDGAPFSADDLVRLQERMETLVSADLPITQVRVPLSEALTTFHASGDHEKAELFAKRRKGDLPLYELNGVRDYFHGFMVPRTGLLRYFALRLYGDGFILLFPRRRDPDLLQPFEDEERLARVFHNYNQWLRIVGVPGVASLNRAAENGRLREVILVSEALHSLQLSKIAGQIADRRDQLRIILVAGPSSAGKTTFSKRLAVQLLAHGIHPVAIAMDNYFVNREDTPRDAQGDYDFEHLEAVDLPLFRSHLQALLRGETVVPPVFNFLTGKRVPGKPLALRRDEMLIIEGIHGLNPALAEGVESGALYRIFVSAFTQLNLDRHNRIPTTDTRKLRRLVRDFWHRGYSAADTLRRWPKVREGEKQWIFPFQNNADVFFNSALSYELAAIKPLAEPILLQVEPDTPERIEANRLRAFLQWFEQADDDAMRSIPGHSILREFIGDGLLDDFEPWS